MEEIGNIPTAQRVIVDGEVLCYDVPTLDLWLIDPKECPCGRVDGYLLKSTFDKNGRLVRIDSSYRDLSLLLRQATIARSALDTARF